MNRIEKLKRLIETGWSITIDEYCFYAMIGDTNCPHRQEYNPQTGHGFSTVDIDIDLFEESVDRLYEKCLKQVNIPV